MAKTARKPAAKAAADDWRRTAAARVRMYRHGLGDCFLLTFPRPRGHDFNVLIDCGVILGTPDGAGVTRRVVDDLAATLDRDGTPTLDVLVATHEHWDHLSAFADHRAAWDGFEIGQVWMAWTEQPGNTVADDLRDKRAAKVKKLKDGVKRLKVGLTAAGALGADGTSGPAAADYRRAAEVLSFFGVDPDDADEPEDGPGAAEKPTRAKKLGITDAMDWCRTHKGAAFWSPGDVIEKPNMPPGLRAFVLGPPKDLKQLHKPLPTKAGHETYELAVGGAAGDADEAAPFDAKYRIRPEHARAADFFRTHYFGAGPDDPDAWRRIDGTGLAGAAAFALQLDSDTNNTSLALAFELADGRVLLFPADAQVGNWESWHADSDGKPRTWATAAGVTATDLLRRAVVYKVGHHGSHNATLRGNGLELMTSPDLVALVPVDTHIAHDTKHWCRMPFDPLVAALRALTNGRLVLADQPLSVLPPGTFPAGRAADASTPITVDGPNGEPVKRPLYVDYYLPATAAEPAAKRGNKR